MKTDSVPDLTQAGDVAASGPPEAQVPARGRPARPKLDVDLPAVFVLRMPHPGTGYAWEVRRYSAIVLARGDGYATDALARAAGERALITMGTNDPVCPS